MIVSEGKKLKPKEAARMIVWEAIGLSTNHWEEDTDSGFYIGQQATPEEMSQISQEIVNLTNRINRNVLKLDDLHDKLAQREDIE